MSSWQKNCTSARPEVDCQGPPSIHLHLFLIHWSIVSQSKPERALQLALWIPRQHLWGCSYGKATMPTRGFWEFWTLMVMVVCWVLEPLRHLPRPLSQILTHLRSLCRLAWHWGGYLALVACGFFWAVCKCHGSSSLKQKRGSSLLSYLLQAFSRDRRAASW